MSKFSNILESVFYLTFFVIFSIGLATDRIIYFTDGYIKIGSQFPGPFGGRTKYLTFLNLVKK